MGIDSLANSMRTVAVSSNEVSVQYSLIGESDSQRNRRRRGLNDEKTPLSLEWHSCDEL